MWFVVSFHGSLRADPCYVYCRKTGGSVNLFWHQENGSKTIRSQELFSWHIIYTYRYAMVFPASKAQPFHTAQVIFINCQMLHAQCLLVTL